MTTKHPTKEQVDWLVQNGWVDKGLYLVSPYDGYHFSPQKAIEIHNARNNIKSTTIGQKEG